MKKSGNVKSHILIKSSSHHSKLVAMNDLYKKLNIAIIEQNCLGRRGHSIKYHLAQKSRFVFDNKKLPDRST